jgi:hypothetical protein
MTITYVLESIREPGHYVVSELGLPLTFFDRKSVEEYLWHMDSLFVMSFKVTEVKIGIERLGA